MDPSTGEHHLIQPISAAECLMSPESSCGGLDDSSPSDDKPFLSPICPSGSAPKRNYSELPLLLLIIVKSQSSEITEILSVG